MKVRHVVATGLFSALLPCMTMADETVLLKPVQSENGNGFRQVQFDEAGQATIPFATKSGKLRLQFKDGKIRADVNDDGMFDDKDGAGIGPQETLSIPIKTHGLDVDYSLQFAFGEGQMAFLVGRTRLSGTVKDQPIHLSDTNLNGTFNEALVDSILVGKEMIETSMGPNVCLANAIWTWSMADDKGELVLKPYVGPTGRLALKIGGEGWSGRIVLVKTDGQFSAVALSGAPTLLIPGDYRVDEVTCSKGEGEQAAGLSGETEKTITITEGDNALSFGSPFTVKLTASKSKDDPRKLSIEDVKLVDAGGFAYRADLGQDGSSLQSFLQSGTNRTHFGKLEYG